MPQQLRRKDDTQNVLFTLDHKDAYQLIRNYLAGRFVGATRDEVLLDEVLKCLFCKVYLVRSGDGTRASSDAAALATSYKQAFAELRSVLPTVFDNEDELLLDPTSLAYVDEVLGTIEVDSWEKDPFGDAYEAFMGSHIRGQEGQFFTPRTAVDLLVSVVDPRPGEKVIDPACGSGGFLAATARHFASAGASFDEVAADLYGVDKDRYLARLASAHLSMSTLAPSKVFCADSLSWAANDSEFPLENHVGKFDVVLTNPPFGSRIKSVSREVQKSFELGYKWRLDKDGSGYVRLNELRPSVPPQVLFVERCLSLVRPGGRVGMVVPESLVSSKNYRYVVQYLRANARLRAVMGMPESLFKTSGKGGTHTKTCLLVFEKANPTKDEINAKVFMAEAHWCGHDSRGRRIEHNDLPKILERYRQHTKASLSQEGHLGYSVATAQLAEDMLAPRYYDPEVVRELESLRDTHELVKLGDLVEEGHLQVRTGDEVGKLAYGTGSVPFVRTSDISNWEVKLDPKHCVSEQIFAELAQKQDIRAGDILMVKDGTYLIGTCAFVTKYDTRILYQSHLYKLRVADHSRLSPHLLLAVLSSAPVRKQIQAKRLTQDIIDSLGNRIYELVLPIPKQESVRNRVSGMVERAINERVEARELARRSCLEVIGTPVAQDEEQLADLRGPQV